MTPKSEFLSSALADYVAAQATPRDPLLTELAEYTAGLGRISGMQISGEQGMFMSLLTRLIRPRFAVEVGTFTGYSAICMARELAPDGKLLCCDISAEWTAVAQKFWERDGIAERIEVRLAPAVETLRGLPSDPPIDLAFIDADKGGYASYWAELVPRMRPGGVILVDNVLWSGRIVDPADTDPDTLALREFAEIVRGDSRVSHVLVPIGDGLTMAVRN